MTTEEKMAWIARRKAEVYIYTCLSGLLGLLGLYELRNLIAIITIITIRFVKYVDMMCVYMYVAYINR